MSVVTQNVFAAPGVLFPNIGGGGGGGGGNLVASTITLTGLNPISATLSSSPNDGFEVRNGGGGSNVVTITTIDAGNATEAEMGNRVISTISGNPVYLERFEMVTIPSQGNSGLYHYNQTSTLGYVAFINTGDMNISALPTASGGANSAINLLANKSTIIFQPQGVEAAHFRLPVSTNTYVPQAGTTQNLGAFTSIVGNAYDVRLPVRIDAVSQPTAGDWSLITTDTATAPTALATFEMAQVSSVGNQYESHLCGTIVASGTTTTIQALGKPAAGTSTAVTIAGSAAYIRNLGVPQAQ